MSSTTIFSGSECSGKTLYRTYTSGFNMSFGMDISRSKFVELCEELSVELGTQVEPEPITEGGFSIKTNIGYKSFRLSMGYDEWPWIKPTVMEDWKDDYTILIKAGIKLSSFLKASYGAPVFTPRQLDIFSNCLLNYGVVVWNIPKPESLTELVTYTSVEDWVNTRDMESLLSQIAELSSEEDSDY